MRILYFAWLRTKIGTSEEELAPPPDVATTGDLITWLRSRGPGYADALANRAVVKVAVNQDYVGLDHPLSPNDEVALFPPVTGG
ncbi:molybdopterin converting factor subunit 1 [Nitrospirillum iridis]|uniref:Molybdopterin synthase sulfur carrier subunit n=1 Tax=Nitrospirillum iridis TaxID=765888 RepID=A0A7X0B1V8_9PROT|nr:molybdopterin converting factor subunit 1 [Nitrospirillum iridis]MBB6254165.1 molybdopterin synthase sulfur carrier subunit [Nitrospirillum iridis]